MHSLGFLAISLTIWLVFGLWLSRCWTVVGRSARRWWLLWSLAGMTALGAYTLNGTPGLLLRLDQPPQSAASPPPFIRELQQRIEANPQDAEALSTLAEAQLTIGRPAEAEELYRRAVLASSGDMQLILRYGEVQVIAADGEVSDKAKRSFEVIHQIRPNDPTARFYLGLYYQQQGQPGQAEVYWAELERQLPADHPWLAMMRR